MISITDDDDGKLYKPKQPSVTNRIARIGRNTGVPNLNDIYDNHYFDDHGHDIWKSEAKMIKMQGVLFIMKNLLEVLIMVRVI